MYHPTESSINLLQNIALVLKEIDSSTISYFFIHIYVCWNIVKHIIVIIF